jgi:hypothetical protein
VDVQTCKGERLNAVGADFSHSIQQHQIFQSFKCWRQYDLNEVLQDFIWKPTVCDIVVRNGVSNKGESPFIKKI